MFGWCLLSVPIWDVCSNRDTAKSTKSFARFDIRDLHERLSHADGWLGMTSICQNYPPLPRAGDYWKKTRSRDCQSCHARRVRFLDGLVIEKATRLKSRQATQACQLTSFQDGPTLVVRFLLSSALQQSARIYLQLDPMDSELASITHASSA